MTKLQWIEILLDKALMIDLDIAIFQGLYSFEGHKAPASQIGLILGYTGKNTSSALNLEIIRLGKRIAKKYEVAFHKREDGSVRIWDLFFNGWSEKPFFIWQLRPELKEALEETGLTGEEYYPEEIPVDEQATLKEGLKRTIIVNTYERNARARQKCIEYWQTICCICEFDFEEKYGEIGKGFIHVHHLIPVSDIGKTYQINPIKDLRPVCSNCHSMLHRQNPPLTIEEIKEKIKKPVANHT
ncbi:HNH endonuclease [Pontibacter qinzhouensis]|uniref:HNH endonuclease n=1 Tax=Pontibacter qinzhouensis TaxID=2603253 RepID=UPI0021052C7D|nr:HNH endonuclease [Pontibacter qinzhouensis]